MNKLQMLIARFVPKQPSEDAYENPTTTQLRMGSETRQLQGLKLVKSVPFFGEKSFTQQYKILTYVLVPLAMLTIGSIYYSKHLQYVDSVNVENSIQLQMLSQRSARLATDIANGNTTAPEKLKESLLNITKNVEALESTSLFQGHSDKIIADIQKFKDVHASVAPQLETLANNAKNIQNLQQKTNGLNDVVTSSLDIVERLRVMHLAETSASSTHKDVDALAATLLGAKQLILSLATGPQNDDALKALTLTGEKLKATTNALLEGHSQQRPLNPGAYKRQIEALHVAAKMYEQHLNESLKQIQSVAKSKRAAEQYNLRSEELLNIATSITSELEENKNSTSALTIFSIVLGLLSGGVIVFWLWLKLQETRLTSSQIDESIEHLMTDLIEIADGNLTVRARMTENHIGSIADSVNLTVNRLNRTLSTVKESSQIVRRGAEQMTNDAAVILEAVRDQVAKIKNASASVNSIADSVQAVAFAAEQSSEVAAQQQDATKQGGDAVRATIEAMQRIRDQIQDTAKRVKRVGESAQEIDEIIELISSTTEQTNVLAMNASIQAAAAGEAGRGFRAVATEVQRLAERSDHALRRIVTLVRSVQTDTQNAVSAMERSTQEVVDGAKTTVEASDAFIRIEQVSAELTDLIKAITEATQQQAHEASSITERMGEILSISDNTAKGVEQTTSGIQTIAELAEELDDTMGRFTL